MNFKPEELIGVLEARGPKQLKVHVGNYKGKPRVDIRFFEYDAYHSDFARGTGKGANVGADQLDGLIELLQQAKERAAALEGKREAAGAAAAAE